MSGHDCSGCSVAGAAADGAAPGLQRLGAVRADRADRMLALAGNPNTGKSTLFNRLSGLRQRTGNWSGTTVASAVGGFRYLGHTYRLVDLPGAYSLLAVGNEEEVTRDFLLTQEPDATVVVVDAGRLERTLPLALQILELTARVVVAVNLIDEVRRDGGDLDLRHLARELGAPAVPVSARTGEGIAELVAAVDRVAGSDLTAGRSERTARAVGHPSRTGALQAAVDGLTEVLVAEYPLLPHAAWVARRLLEGDPGVARALREGTLAGAAAR